MNRLMDKVDTSSNLYSWNLGSLRDTVPYATKNISSYASRE